jgi:ERCC4-type nuclease
MEPEKYDIIANTRERDSELAGLLENEEIKVGFAPLRYADFLIGGRLAIIRRTNVDFIADLKSKMLYRTLVFFKREYPEPLYLVEGDKLSVNGTPLPTIRSGITHIAAVTRIPIIFTTDAADTAKYMSLLVKQSRFASPAPGERDSAEAEDEQPLPFQLKMLTQLPDVTGSIAQRMMDKFGTLKGVFCAKVTELQKIKGLGPKKAWKIKQAIEAKLDNKIR